MYRMYDGKKRKNRIKSYNRYFFLLSLVAYLVDFLQLDTDDEKNNALSSGFRNLILLFFLRKNVYIKAGSKSAHGSILMIDRAHYFTYQSVDAFFFWTHPIFLFLFARTCSRI